MTRHGSRADTDQAVVTSGVLLLVEDAPVSTGGTPMASVTTGPSTVWLMATIVFKHA